MNDSSKDTPCGECIPCGMVSETRLKQRKLSKETTCFTCNSVMSHKMNKIEVAPSFKSQMENYKKTARKWYEEHLVTKQMESNSELNNPNFVYESIIPNRNSNQTGRPGKRRGRQARTLQQQQQQQQPTNQNNNNNNNNKHHHSKSNCRNNYLELQQIKN